MTFDVPVEPVGRRRRGPWPIWVVAAGPVLVALVAIAGGAFAGDPPAEHAAAAQGPAAASPGQSSIASVAAAAVPRHPRRLPAMLTCEDLRLDDCVRVARAAMAILPDDVADLSGASVWRSLRCGDTPDCPSEYLRGSLPLGSVILEFADGSPAAAINVVEWRYGEAIRLGPRAWLVEWLEAPG